MATPNMGLTAPTVSSTPGPTWANYLNGDLTLIDAHDHTSGNGVQITPAGININANLPFNGNSITTLVKCSFTSQSGALSGTNFLSFVGGNLYVNDGSGNQIPITSGGGVAGSPGSIGSLSAPAAATYSAGSKTFLWTADSSKAAAMDNGAVTIRETNVASAKGITLASPSALAADYQWTLPGTLPGSNNQIIICSTSGALGHETPDDLAATMTATGANTILSSVTSCAATQANLIANARTRTVTTNGTDPGAGGVSISTTTGTYTPSVTTTFADATNLACTLTTTGRPVELRLISSTTGSSPGGNQSYLRGQTGSDLVVSFVRASTRIGNYTIRDSAPVPPSAVSHIDTPAAGTYTFKVQLGSSTAGPTTANATFIQLMAYEL